MGIFLACRLRSKTPVVVIAAVVVIVTVVVASSVDPSASAAARRSHITVTSHRSTAKLVNGRGGTVTVDAGPVPMTLNDHSAAGANATSELVAGYIWAQVFEFGPGTQSVASPQLDTNVVQSAEVVSVNPQTAVYQINPKAMWSDGVPVNAEDFVYAWQSQRGGAIDVDGNPDSVASTLGYRDIDSVTGTNGGRTVTVVFHTPFADWESLFDELLPAHVAAQVGWNNGFNSFNPTTLVSAGPFKVASWTPGSQLVLERNPRWWGPVPALDKIVFDTDGGADADVAALRSGRVAVANESDFDASFLAQVSSTPTLESQVDAGTTMLQLDFNLRHDPLSSQPVRQGLARAIDRTAIVSQATGGLQPGAQPDDNYLFANVQSAYNADGTAYDRPDVTDAAKLLAQGGLVANAQGTWTFHGAPVSLDFVWSSDDPWSEAVGPMVAAELVSVGFDVYADPVPSATLFGAVLPQGAFDLALVPVTAGVYPTSMAQDFSATAGTNGTGVAPDWSGFDDPKVDALFTDAAQDLNAATAQSTYQQIDQDLWSEMPSLPLFAEPTLLVSSTSVAGVQDNPGALTSLWDISQWARRVVASSKGAAHATTGTV